MRQAIEQVEQQIERACRQSGRERREVQLIAVSKTKPVALIQEAWENGLRTFGESRAQEFRDKVKQLPVEIEWHFIGHLQKNKIKYVAPHCTLLHSVDSLELGQALSEFAVKKQINVAVLMEVNTAREASKFGVEPDRAGDVYQQLCNLPGIEPKGLMTIGPYVQDEKHIRQAFAELRELREALRPFLPEDNLRELSMGMSQDYFWAILEGSTMVRVGTALFGAREVL